MSEITDSSPERREALRGQFIGIEQLIKIFGEMDVPYDDLSELHNFLLSDGGFIGLLSAEGANILPYEILTSATEQLRQIPYLEDREAAVLIELLRAHVKPRYRHDVIDRVQRVNAILAGRQGQIEVVIDGQQMPLHGVTARESQEFYTRGATLVLLCPEKTEGVVTDILIKIQQLSPLEQTALQPHMKLYEWSL